MADGLNGTIDQLMGATPEASAPTRPAGGADRSALLRLAALIPIAMSRGGSPAVAGLLNGFQRAQAQQQALAQQQDQQDWSRSIQERQLGRLESAEDRQQAQVDAQTAATAAEQRQKFLQLAMQQGGDPNLTPEEAFSRLQLLTRQAPQGVSQTDIEAATFVSPTRRERSRIEKALADVEKNFGKARFEKGEADGLKITSLDPQRFPNGLTVGEAKRLVSGVEGTLPPPAATEDGKSDFDRHLQRHYAAAKARLRRDLTLDELVSEELVARKNYGQADDRTRITVTTGPNSPRTDTRVDRIVAAFNSHPIVKEFNEVQAQHGIIKSVVNGPWSGPGDMAAVFAFMKALDPNSVVRETEYANAAKSGNIFAGWAARFNGALSESGGFLSDRVRRDFLRTIDSRLAIKGQQYQNLRKQLVARVDRIKAGAPETGDEALIDYSSAVPPAAPPPAGGTDAPPAPAGWKYVPKPGGGWTAVEDK